MAAWTCRQFAGKAASKIVPLRSRTPCWKGLGADSEEKREPVSDFNAGVVDSLKALDPNGRLEKQSSQREMLLHEQAPFARLGNPQNPAVA